MSEDRMAERIRRHPIKTFMVVVVLLAGVGLTNAQIDWSDLLAQRGVVGAAMLLGAALIAASLALALVLCLLFATVSAGGYVGGRIYRRGIEQGAPKMGAFYSWLVGGGLGLAIFLAGVILLKAAGSALGPLFAKAFGEVAAR